MQRTDRYFTPGTLRVCIDQMSETNLEGRIYCKMQANQIVFSNVAELLVKADEMFDQKGFPQAFQQKRTFAEELSYVHWDVNPVMYLTDEQMNQFQGKETTIDIIVVSRKHTTWQGFVREPSGRIKGEFEGDIALIKILNSII